MNYTFNNNREKKQKNSKIFNIIEILEMRKNENI